MTIARIYNFALLLGEIIINVSVSDLSESNSSDKSNRVTSE